MTSHAFSATFSCKWAFSSLDIPRDKKKVKMPSVKLENYQRVY